MLDNHLVPEGHGILPYVVISGYKIPSYSLFVMLGLLVGMTWFFLTIPPKKNVSKENTCYIVLSALLFGLIGSKILVIIENLNFIVEDFGSIKNLLFNGKSIVGGLIGGYFGIRFIKKRLNIESVRTGNEIAPAIALGMAIGRIGCFLVGCCYGVETNLSIGVDFGDGITRIPTQLIEMIFCLGMFGYFLYKQKKKKDLIPGILFKELILYYFVFRFIIEFIRDTSKIVMFISVYQIICILGIIYILKKIKKEKVLWINKKLEQ